MYKANLRLPICGPRIIASFHSFEGEILEMDAVVSVPGRRNVDYTGGERRAGGCKES